MRPDMQALTGLLWAFGKRISENLAIRRGEIFTANGFLNVRFHVLKKRTKSSDTYLKRISLKHPSIKYVLHYIDAGDMLEIEPEALIFPDLTRQTALYYLKKANPNAYLHLFRKSLATEFSEHGYSIQQLMAWFDWDRADIAMGYVQRSAALTKEMSERNF